jgi:hypothetical protein
MTQDQDKARWEDLLSKDIQSVFREETADLNPDEGLERFMAAVAANPKAQIPASWWQRLNTWLAGIGISPALASAVAMVQLGVIAALLATQLPTARDEAPESVYRGATSPVRQEPDLRITINPDADFASLTALLRANNCRIVAGPSELGELWIAVDDEKTLLEIRKSLEQSSLIDDVVAHQ